MPRRTKKDTPPENPDSASETTASVPEPAAAPEPQPAEPQPAETPDATTPENPEEQPPASGDKPEDKPEDETARRGSKETLDAAEGVKSFSCAAGEFEVKDGKITVPADAVDDAIASGYFTRRS